MEEPPDIKAMSKTKNTKDHERTIKQQSGTNRKDWKCLVIKATARGLINEKPFTAPTCEQQECDRRERSRGVVGQLRNFQNLMLIISLMLSSL